MLPDFIHVDDDIVYNIDDGDYFVGNVDGDDRKSKFLHHLMVMEARKEDSQLENNISPDGSVTSYDAERVYKNPNIQ